MLELLTVPFLQRALLGGLILGVLLAYLGVFIVIRKMAFFGDGIAHASLAGIAVGMLTSTNPLIIAVVYSAILAVLIYLIEKKTSLSSDVTIGLFFTASMALGIILVGFKQGYQPELISFLFGNILIIQNLELAVMSVLAVLILSYLIVFHRQITFITLDREGAQISGVNTALFDLIFYIVSAVSVVLGVKILGIVLVSALLLIPPSIGKLLAKSFKSFIWLSIVAAEFIVFFGLFLSYVFDLPSGATIILFGFSAFLLVLILKKAITSIQMKN